MSNTIQLICQIIVESSTVIILLLVACWIGSNYLLNLVTWFDERKVWKQQCAERPVQDELLVEEIRRKETELSVMRKLLSDARLLGDQCLKVADEREDMTIFLMNQERARKDLNPLEILFVGEALDEVRSRMGKARKGEGPRSLIAEDLVIEAGLLCHFVDLLRAQGVEPPAAFYKLQQMLRAIKPKQDPRKKS